MTTGVFYFNDLYIALTGVIIFIISMILINNMTIPKHLTKSHYKTEGSLNIKQIKYDEIERLELEYPYLQHSNRVQKWINSYTNQDARASRDIHFASDFINAIKEFNDFCLLNTITCKTPSNTRVYSHIHGECIFKFWSPVATPVIQLYRESFSRVTTRKNLLEIHND